MSLKSGYKVETGAVIPSSLRYSRTASPSLSTLALGVSAALLGSPVMAQSADDEPMVLDTLQIEERAIDTNPYTEPGAPYKANVSGDQRRVNPIADTPATISVLTQTQIKESGKSDLREVLAAQPGVTLGTGENGNAFGDRYIVRGHEARSDVFVDGLRDPGMTTRESFATEQVEITKGPSSTFAGRGSSGGAINSITKQASSEYNFNHVEAALGSDDYRRVTLDSNNRFSDSFAVRANVLHTYEDVPNRAPASRERNGVALSALWHASERVNLTADYYYLEAQDAPDLGTYIVSGGEPVDDLPVYLQQQDFLESDVETFTLRLDTEINAQLNFANATRFGTTDNGYVVTGARGTNRDESDLLAPGAATIGLSTHQGWQEVEYFVNQSNLYLDTQIADMNHQFVFSLEYSDMSVVNGVFNVENTGATNCITGGRRGANPNYCIVDPSGATVANIDSLMGRQITRGGFDSDYNIDTISVAVMDTIELSDRWSVFLGLRLDSFDYQNNVVGGGATEPTTYEYSDELWNGHVGAVYNVSEQGNIYLTYSSATNINGGESDVGGNCGYGGICGGIETIALSEPEQVSNLELGTKWELLDGKLLATASVFQITKDDIMEGEDYSVVGTLNTGKNRVQGVEFSVVGNLTDRLSTQFGVSTMDSEVLASVDPDNIGKRLSNFADDSVFMQLKYQASPKFAVGGSITYSSELFSGQPDAAASETYKVPGYTVVDMFASYAFSDTISARVNIGNLTDEDYYLASYRSGAFTYIGDARRADLSVKFEF
ncbi:iron transport outer membrane receptor [Arenicella chitinivorans]|uniref:Iron transport outer membrane receptor n=1 Tax=Arenicella chitinivorans TaxID=1329800 RepID=A0A918RJE7_9GAMM|nr:TonB-dependent siderophore receptor [Arenicella chitinivorans]GHA00323.1 iron transport outer membrane receptor [Arenicella chitinivorans]